MKTSALAPAIVTTLSERTRRLSFERGFLLESRECTTCYGSGIYSANKACWNCRGIGRRITVQGRDLFYSIACLLGVPIEEKDRESRVPVDHFRFVLAERVASGMRVADLYVTPRVMRDVIDVEAKPFSRLITFRDGTKVNVPGYTMFARELTDAELDRAEVWMSQHLGKGAVEAQP